MKCPLCFNSLKKQDRKIFCSFCDFFIELQDKNFLNQSGALILLNMELENIEKEGSNAFNSSRFSCPYNDGSIMSKAWYRGFNQEKENNDKLADYYASTGKIEELISQLNEMRCLSDKKDRLYNNLYEIIYRFVYRYERSFFWNRHKEVNKFIDKIIELVDQEDVTSKEDK